MICKNCGTQNPDTSNFCQKCGENLSAQSPFNATPGFNPMPGGYAPYPATDEGKGFAIASLVLGILSFIIFGIIFGILAIIFGAVAKSKGSRSPMATAGIIIGAIGLGLTVVGLAIGFAFLFSI